jgi:hypothetical protein
MSSEDYPESANIGGGILNDDPDVNGDFYSWTTVFVRYCSSDYWVGVLEETRPTRTTIGIALRVTMNAISTAISMG